MTNPDQGTRMQVRAPIGGRASSNLYSPLTRAPSA